MYNISLLIIETPEDNKVNDETVRQAFHFFINCYNFFESIHFLIFGLPCYSSFSFFGCDAVNFENFKLQPFGIHVASKQATTRHQKV